MDIETKRQSTQALLESAELLFTEAECRAALQKVADAISHDLSDKYPLLLPVMGGAVVFTGQLLPLLRFPLDFDYVHVSRYGDKLQGGNFNWLRMPNPEQIAGRHVVILDDILDEGHTLLAVKQWCEDQGAAEVRIAVLAEKLHDRCVDGICADYIGVEVPDRYVFGFGMDYYEQGRNLPAIYALKD